MKNLTFHPGKLGLFILLFINISIFAQKDNITYKLPQPDPRILITLHQNRTMGLGSQYVGVSIVNLTDDKLRVKLEFFANMVCGEQLKQKIGFGEGVIIKARDTLKAGGFFDSKNTSFDAANRRSSACLKSPNKSKELPDGKFTAVQDMGFNLLGVTKEAGPNNPSGTSGSTVTTTGTSGTGTTTSGSTGGNSPGKNGNCPTYGFKLGNSPSINCVALEWWALSTKTNKMDANGNFSQSSDPEAKYFLIEYRKKGDINWMSEKHPNAGRNIQLLTELDACTAYEVRLTSICDNNAVSAPTNILTFKTACTVPSKFAIENITKTSAQLNSQPQSVSSYPCPVLKNRVREVEYKSGSGNWETIICNSGSPCVLNALAPGATYRVRARYKYPNAIYSEYTNEVVFTTKAK